MGHPVLKETPLDELDRQLLLALDNDARTPISTLSSVCNVSRDRASYCLDGLTSSGIIRGFTIGTNPYRTGKTLYKTYFLLEKNEENIAQKIIAFLKKQPGVFWIAEAEGRWDLVYAAYARNPYEFSGLQDVVLEKFARQIASFELYTVIEAVFFPRKYLWPAAKTEESRLGGEPANITLDETDLEIIKLLSENSRLPMTALAERVCLSPTATKYRVERLEREKIIVGYRLDIDLGRVGYQSFKAQYYPKSHALDEKLLDFCRTHPNVVCMIHQLGECKIELEIDARDFNHYNEILSELRAKFSGTVRTINFRSQYYASYPSDG